jgi:hypothetical protein
MLVVGSRMRILAAMLWRASADAALIRAEAEIAACLKEADALGDAGEAFAIRADHLDRFIASTPPRTLEGATVKLRRLLDPETGIAVGPNELDTVALAQVLALLHGLVGLPRHPTRPTCGIE